MRRTQILFQQHSGRMFRDKWKIQGKKILVDNGALKQLNLNNIPYRDANLVVKEEPKLIRIELDKLFAKTLSNEEELENCPEDPCLIYSDHNVLMGGLDQAKVFTNSCEVDADKLPVLDELNIQVDSHESIIKKLIKSSLVYDATQEKLPKRKDPERPALVFPRDYGITDRRKNYLLGKRLVQFCAALNPQLLDHRMVLDGPLNFKVALNRDGHKVLLSNRADLLITSKDKITPTVDQRAISNTPLPDIYPLLPLISFEQHNKYKFEDYFPLNFNMPKSLVHTAVVHYNWTEVANLYETEVTESQILARSLMKCYTFALAQARQIFGNDVLDVPEPVTVQCIQMDGRSFHFSIFQLNTTGSHTDTTVRNAYWNLPIMDLYDVCDYVDGKPVLEGYNPKVFNTLFAFFQNS